MERIGETDRNINKIRNTIIPNMIRIEKGKINMNKLKKHKYFVTLIIVNILSLIILITTTLIYYLNYFPYTKLEYKKGWCTNTKTYFIKLIETKKDKFTGLYIYETDIINNINGSFVARSQGCVVTSKDSYKLTKRMKSIVNLKNDYEINKNILPIWLCNFANEKSELWNKIDVNSKKNTDINLMNVNGYTSCKYTNLYAIKKSANVKNNDYAVDMSFYGSSFMEIKNTYHYKSTMIQMYISLIITIFINIMFSVIYLKKY